MPRRMSKTDVSLFPFLSVLCAVIGILILFIVLTLSTRVVVEGERYERDPKPQTPGLEDVVEQGIAKDDYARLEAELESLAGKLLQRQAERDALKKNLAGLEDTLQSLITDLEVPWQMQRQPGLNDPQPVSVVPDRDPQFHVPKTPILVEVSSVGYVIHPEGTAYPPIKDLQDSTGDWRITADMKLAAYLKSVYARRDKEYLLFLIHPNGVAAFDTMRIYLAQMHADLDIGWEPFARQWIMANEPNQEPPRRTSDG